MYKKNANKYGKNFFKNKTMELGMSKKNSNMLLASNTMHFYSPSSF